jgi:hypothetical protein
MASKGYCNRGRMGVQTGDDIKDTIICSYSRNVFLPSNSGKVNPLIRNLFQLFLLFIYCLWFRLKQWREAYKIKNGIGTNWLDSMKCEAFLCCYFYAVLGWCGAVPVQSEFIFVFRVSSGILIHDSRYCFALWFSAVFVWGLYVCL